LRHEKYTAWQIPRRQARILRMNTGRFLDSLGVKKRRMPMMGRRTAPRGATMRMTVRKWWRDMPPLALRGRDMSMSGAKEGECVGEDE
jgi:hypothetical protein